MLAAIEYPEIAENNSETLAALDCGSLDSLRNAVLDACASGKLSGDGGLRAALEAEGFSDILRRLESDRIPMRAALGGSEAPLTQRETAWNKLAASYMDRLDKRTKREEIRNRLDEEIGRGDSDNLRRLVEAFRRTGEGDGPV